jgi:hypothetical protein
MTIDKLIILILSTFVVIMQLELSKMKICGFKLWECNIIIKIKNNNHFLNIKFKNLKSIKNLSGKPKFFLYFLLRTHRMNFLHQL